MCAACTSALLLRTGLALGAVGVGSTTAEIRRRVGQNYLGDSAYTPLHQKLEEEVEKGVLIREAFRAAEIGGIEEEELRKNEEGLPDLAP
jgi:hypothetical protein